MSINLGKYVITSDSSNFVLNTKRINKKGKAIGETVLVADSFHGTWKSLSAKLLQLELLETDAESLQDIDSAICQFTHTISEKLAELTGIARPSEQGAIT